MKSYYVFESDNKFIVLEVLQHNGRFFHKKINEFLSLDLAEKCAKMLSEDGVPAMASGTTLGAGQAKADGGSGNVDGYPTMLFKKLARRKKPRK